MKQANIDKRYDALIAGLLQPTEGKAKTYCKVNFITWNYDLNLFCSLKNYFNPSNYFEEFKRDITVGENHWNIDDQINVINMNGFFYSTFFDKIKNLLDNEYLFHDIFDKTHLKNKYQIDSEKIKFAWENKFIGQTNSVISAAIDVIRKSKTIVVIGYTFPLYNRLVDLDYFNESTLYGKTLVIQDPR
ncbi:MAG: hypothetical protein IPP48_12960 [Chitinophagaceae bacterium]|nr:hypothetical protein [Chitinophagaceae bacterium]